MRRKKSVSKVSSDGSGTVGICSKGAGNVIVIAVFILYYTCIGCFATIKVINTAIFCFVNSTYIFKPYAIFSKEEICFQATCRFYCLAQTGKSISLKVEVIFFAFISCPFTYNPVACPVISFAIFIFNPMAFYKNIIFKGISIRSYNLYAINCCKIRGAEIVIIFSINNPSGFKASYHCVIYFFSGSYNAVNTFQIIFFFTFFADKFSINNNIFMAFCFKGSAPIYNRTATVKGVARIFSSVSTSAAYAKSASGISGRYAGCFFILRFALNMDMPAVFCVFFYLSVITSVFIEFRNNRIVFRRESGFGFVNKFNYTFFYVNNNCNAATAIAFPHSGRSIYHFTAFSVNKAVGVVNMVGIFPGANRKRCKNSFSGCNSFSCSGNNNVSIVVVFINGIFCGKSGKNFHMVKFPNAHTVKVEIEINFLNFFSIISLKVHIIYRTDRKVCKSRICRNKSYGAFSSVDNNLSGGFSGVSCVIFNFKYESVNAIIKLDIVNADYAGGRASIAAVKLYSINIYSCRRRIDAGVVVFCGIFFCFCHNSDDIGGCSLAVHFIVHIAISEKSNSFKFRSLSVFNNSGIVNSDVVDINSKSGFYVGYIFFSFVITVGMIEVKVIKGGFADLGCIYRNIVPVCFRIKSSCIAVIKFIPVLKVKFKAGLFRIDIHPETNSYSVCKIDVKSGKFKHLVTHCIEIRIVADQCKRIFTVSYFTGGGIYNFHFPEFKAAKFRMISMFALIATFKSKAGNITVFKIPNNFRTLTKVNACTCGNCFVINKNSTYNTSGNAGIFIASSIAESVNATKLFIGKSYNKVCCFNSNFVDTAVNGCFNFKLSSFVIRNSNIFLCKENVFRNYNFNRSFANNFSAINKLCNCSTNGSVGYENTVFDSAHGRICKLPFSICGNFCRAAGRVCTGCNKGYFRTGSYIVIFCFNRSMVEFSICNCFGNNKKTAKCCTFTTVRRAGFHGKFTGTFTFGNKSRGTATIAVNCVYASKCKKPFSKFTHAGTCRIRKLTAVIHKENEFAFCSNTKNRSGGSVGICMIISCILIYTIFNNPTEVCRNCIIAIFRNRFGCTVKRCYTFFSNRKEGLCSTVAVCVTFIRINNTVPNKNAVRMVAFVTKVGVNTTYYVVAKAFNMCCLFGKFLNTPVDRVFKVFALFNTKIGRHYRNVIVSKIHFNYMQNISCCCIVIIKNDFIFSCTGCKCVFIFFNQIVIITT